MRLSPPRRFPTLPPGQAQLPRSHPAHSESDFIHRWYTKYRPWLLTISIGIVVAGGSLLGAELKTEWQKREVRWLRALEKEGSTTAATVAQGGGEETKPKPIVRAAEEGQTSEAAPAPAPAQAPSPVRVLSEKEIQSRNKKIREYVENLEARKKELLMKREEIAVKVRRLQERMRRKEEGQRERERVGREGGTPTIGRVER